jgi:16S rRNA (cytosine1402-N4)-methyltransferase
MHESVLLTESIALLNPQAGRCIVDCTLGAGGHSAALIPRISPGGRLIAFDVDPEAIAIAQPKLNELASAHGVTVNIVRANFRRIRDALNELQLQRVDGILADLGVSSMQFDRPERGFSFRFDHPLDMRMDPSLPETAADLLRNLSEEEIANVLYEFGGEHKSRRIARAIVNARRTQPIATTGQLEELVRRALRIRGHRRIHPATKTFQALRLAVNQELSALEEFLEAAPELLAPEGALGVITFHSLEDRMVKHRFKALAATGRFQQIGKFVAPSDAELERNPRCRSAKLRGIRHSSETT